ncbi:CUB-like domain-containing protein [Caenorhabditis elegans]|uniref:CUB-like domain-containing protein n=1 Tax=Caenorhabditis elegans TaxID=6239 RepID=V6CKA7_CAEEL|nr:CUB-like domain-containing protein [Caenorhabditis elegans]CDK13471.1 CUB-like domain-containing protein [Caenorhabditis elegans]|eukprot:NP_001293764.1 Uncharacterized protein CELE_C17H12.6 [Caenorhabditis elegans]
MIYSSTMSATPLIISLGLLVGVTAALDCTQIPNNAIIPLSYTTIPAGATGLVEIPPNFNCVYNVKVPKMVYARVRLENGLKGYNDLITVQDQQGTYTRVSSRSPSVLNFYVFPNTTTTFQVVTKSVDMHSSFRMIVFYQPMYTETVTHLGNPDMKYFMLNDLQENSYKTPQTIISNEKVRDTSAPEAV